MTSFARFYDNKKLVNISMDDIEKYITDERNKKKIATFIYHRYYERYLKIFFFRSSEKSKYFDEKNNESDKNIFNTEYKSGFTMMASCCLLIETLASFFEGDDKTPRGQGKQAFEIVFKKAKDYQNELGKFNNENFYSAIRCGILHQGETYKAFKIKRTGALYDKPDSAINATIFTNELKKFLKSYVDELKNAKWDGPIWDNCRVKLRHIISNAKSS